MNKKLKNKIFFVIGASGSGKTSTLALFNGTKSSDFSIVYFDDIGVPSFDKMIEEYGSIEEWQRNKTIE